MLGLSTTIGLLFYYTRGVPNWNILALAPPMFVNAAVAYSLTACFGVTRRTGQNAAIAVIFGGLVYTQVATFVRVQFLMRLPLTLGSILDSTRDFRWFAQSGGPAIPRSMDSAWMLVRRGARMYCPRAAIV